MRTRAAAAPLLVLTTCASGAQATRLAKALVRRELAACVNVIPGVRSVYRWKGKVASDAEHLLLIKTTRGCYKALAAAIRELHPYELPEILAIDPAEADAIYASWIAESVTACAGGAPGSLSRGRP